MTRRILAIGLSIMAAGTATPSEAHAAGGNPVAQDMATYALPTSGPDARERGQVKIAHCLAHGRAGAKDGCQDCGEFGDCVACIGCDDADALAAAGDAMRPPRATDDNSEVQDPDTADGCARDGEA